ncbi:Vacuolar protein sorting 15 [Carabus blaptoides fortunei]
MDIILSRMCLVGAMERRTLTFRPVITTSSGDELHTRPTPLYIQAVATCITHERGDNTGSDITVYSVFSTDLVQQLGTCTCLCFAHHHTVSESGTRPASTTRWNCKHCMRWFSRRSVPQIIVKQTPMESGITKLCVFFGKHKANDVLLSHMITFLNDKELRGSFFDCIIDVAAYVGCHSSAILSPLLYQKTALCELIAETACYLVHLSVWIRQAVAGFMVTAAKTLTILDVQCKIMPHLSTFMKYQLIQMDKYRHSDCC